jgi:hypothetical protein
VSVAPSEKAVRNCQSLVNFDGENAFTIVPLRRHDAEKFVFVRILTETEDFGFGFSAGKKLRIQNSGGIRTAVLTEYLYSILVCMYSCNSRGL